MATKDGKKKASEYLKGWIPWRYMRYVIFVLATAFTLVIPWVTVDGNHFFLLSFIDFKLTIYHFIHHK